MTSPVLTTHNASLPSPAIITCCCVPISSAQCIVVTYFSMSISEPKFGLVVLLRRMYLVAVYSSTTKEQSRTVAMTMNPGCNIAIPPSKVHDQIIELGRVTGST